MDKSTSGTLPPPYRMRRRRVLLALAIAFLCVALFEGTAATVLRNDAVSMIVVAPGGDNYVLLAPHTWGRHAPTVGAPESDAVHWVLGARFPFLEREAYYRSDLHARPGESVALGDGALRFPPADRL